MDNSIIDKIDINKKGYFKTLYMIIKDITLFKRKPNFLNTKKDIDQVNIIIWKNFDVNVIWNLKNELLFFKQIIADNNYHTFFYRNQLNDINFKNLIFDYNEEDYTDQDCDYKNRIIKNYDNIYSLYNNYILSEEDLISNRFPISNENHECKDFIFLNNGNKNEIFIIDCEMIQTELGPELAHIIILDINSEIVYENYIKPEKKIINYLTKYSGVSEDTYIFNEYIDFKTFQNDIMGILDSSCILIGHSLENDLKSMKIIHKKVIDTSILYLTSKGRKLSLKQLSFERLRKKIQKENHDPLEDALMTWGLVKLKIEILSKMNNDLKEKEDKSKSLELLLDILDKNYKLSYISNKEDFFTSNLKKKYKNNFDLEIAETNNINSILSRSFKYKNSQINITKLDLIDNLKNNENFNKNYISEVKNLDKFLYENQDNFFNFNIIIGINNYEKFNSAQDSLFLFGLKN